MKARERKLTVLLSICVGVLILAFFAMIIYPKYTDLSKEADEATTAKNKAEAELAAAKKLDPDEIDKRLRNLKARIPASFELSNAIVRVGERARESNLIWSQGTPIDQSAVADPNAAVQNAGGQTSTIAPQLTRYDFTIVVEGQITDLIKFMSDLTDKSIGRVIIINSLDVQFKNDEGPDKIEATLKLQVVGWDKGADIESQGCTENSEGSKGAADDPDCNRTRVDSSEEGSS